MSILPERHVSPTLHPGLWLAIVGLLTISMLCPAQEHGSLHTAVDLPPPQLDSAALRGPRMLLREGKTAKARDELLIIQSESPNDPEIYFQIGRSHLLDFYTGNDIAKRKLSLALAMEALAAAIAKDPNHIPALRAKAIIHARAELLYYDPNLAYEYANRVAKLEPHANEYLLTLTDWMSGEVRFTQEGGHRVPHDPLLGLDRSIAILDRLLDQVVPFSNEETAAYFQMGKTLSRRGSFSDSMMYFRQALARTQQPAQKVEALHEMGTAAYRMGDFGDAARYFYESLQWGNRPVSQWLLKVAMDQMKGATPALPPETLFPASGLRPANGSQNTFAFEDIAAELGIDRFDGNGTCAWADYDGDGDLDLFLAGAGTHLAVYRNDRGTFREVTNELGLSEVPSGYSLNLVDFDNDGDPDLYIAFNGWSGPMANRLYRNDSGHFVDISATSGAADGGDGFVSLWGDLDNDGLLDLLVVNGVLKDGSTPQIYRNQGDGAFTNITKGSGIDEVPQWGAIGAALGDYDKDGDLDIFINGLDSAPNRLYRNEGNWRFSEVSRKAGVAQAPHNGFVSFFFDFNNDAWPDLLTTSLAPWESVIDGLVDGYRPTSAKAVHPDASRLFRNNGDGTFRDVTLESGLFYPMGTMGAGVADLDNDGFVDIYFGTGDPQLTRLEPNRFFHSNGDGTFSDWTDAAGFARPGNKGHGVSFVDIDHDGDLDVYAQLGGHYPGDRSHNAFYRNLKGNRNAWLQVELLGTKSNRDAIGTQVTLTAGDRIFFQEIKGSEGFGATNPLRLHFGLGEIEEIQKVEVRWPSGLRQTFSNVPCRRSIRIEEGKDSLETLAK